MAICELLDSYVNYLNPPQTICELLDSYLNYLNPPQTTFVIFLVMISLSLVATILIPKKKKKFKLYMYNAFLLQRLFLFEGALYARHCSKPWDYTGEQDR